MARIFENFLMHQYATKHVAVLVMMLGVGLSVTRANDLITQEMNASINVAEKVCLVGNRYRFEANTDGGLTISKLLPGATGKVVVDRIQARGSVSFETSKRIFFVPLRYLSLEYAVTSRRSFQPRCTAPLMSSTLAGMIATIAISAQEWDRASHM
jgi:hypothetical protein